MDPIDNIATDLFFKIRSRFTGLKLGTETGEITIIPEEARFFDFTLEEDGVNLGHISISLAESNSMKVYFSHRITENMNPQQSRKWYNFLREMRLFAKRRLMNFDPRDIAKDNLDRRDYEFLTKVSQSKKQPEQEQESVGESIRKRRAGMMNESNMYGTKSVSYQKLMDTRLIIKHSKTLVDDTQPGARSRNIAALFVENSEGERFKYPFKHLAGARAMQRHVANGGLPYDAIGESIVDMSREISYLRNFNGYVSRNALTNSATDRIVNRSSQRLGQLREQLARLSKQKYYQTYCEEFEPAEKPEVPDHVMQELTEKFTVKSFREDIKDVFPVLYRLMQEEDDNDGMDYSDIVAMTEMEHDTEYDSEVHAVDAGGTSPILSRDPEVRKTAIKKLKELLEKGKLEAGISGLNASIQLQDIITDPELINDIEEIEDSEQDVLDLIRKWIETNLPEKLANRLLKKHKRDSEPTESARASSAVNTTQLAEFIHSHYDQGTGTFPNGTDTLCDMIGEQFGEQARIVADHFVNQMSLRQPKIDDGELARIKQLTHTLTDPLEK